MKGAFNLDSVDIFVNVVSPGAYILSRDGKAADYVGRSDSNLADRIKKSAQEGRGYKYFWYEYTTSEEEAYYKECKWYHEYNPPDNDIHPAAPAGSNLKCPVYGCDN